MWDFYNDMRVLRPLNYVSDNNMLRLSVSESNSKRWTTVKTKVVGGPSFECIDNDILLGIDLKSIVIETVVCFLVVSSLYDKFNEDDNQFKY